MCWKRTGTFTRISVPSSWLPGVATTATASVPAGRPSGLETDELVKCPVYAATQTSFPFGTSLTSRP